MVHGAGPKPHEAAYVTLWEDALRQGLQRDRPEALEQFETAQRTMSFFGELNNSLIGNKHDPELELSDRKLTLRDLAQRNKTKQFRRSHYEQLPGKSALTEFVADLVAPLAGAVGLGKRTIGAFVPEFKSYWANEQGYAQTVDGRIEANLRTALAQPGDILLLSHCIGSVAAYNALWRLSHGEAPIAQKIDLWITLGSPLADDTVKRNLTGRQHKARQRYPTNLIRWHNIAAEDDYMCHDETVSNDFAALLQQRQISQIVDHRIYNLALRHGRSAPHSALGYLVHPRTIDLVADWLVD